MPNNKATPPKAPRLLLPEKQPYPIPKPQFPADESKPPYPRAQHCNICHKYKEKNDKTKKQKIHTCDTDVCTSYTACPTKYLDGHNEEKECRLELLKEWEKGNTEWNTQQEQIRQAARDAKEQRRAEEERKKKEKEEMKGGALVEEQPWRVLLDPKDPYVPLKPIQQNKTTHIYICRQTNKPATLSEFILAAKGAVDSATAAGAPTPARKRKV
jgi:hypothetical protein